MLRLCLYPAWTDVLGACLGCTHMPRSTRDVPMRWGSRTGCSCTAAVHTPNPGVTLCTKESISFHFGAQPQLLLALPACAQHPCLSALTGTFAHLQRGTELPLQHTGQSPRKCLLSPLRMNLDFGSHHGPRAPPTAPGTEAAPAFPSIPV